jgi:hypothetical protein
VATKGSPRQRPIDRRNRPSNLIENSQPKPQKQSLQVDDLLSANNSAWLRYEQLEFTVDIAIGSSGHLYQGNTETYQLLMHIISGYCLLNNLQNETSRIKCAIKVIEGNTADEKQVNDFKNEFNVLRYALGAYCTISKLYISVPSEEKILYHSMEHHSNLDCAWSWNFVNAVACTIYSTIWILALGGKKC